MSRTRMRMYRTSLIESSRATFADPDHTTSKDCAASSQVRGRKKFVSPVALANRVA